MTSKLTLEKVLDVVAWIVVGLVLAAVVFLLVGCIENYNGSPTSASSITTGGSTTAATTTTTTPPVPPQPIGDTDIRWFDGVSEATRNELTEITIIVGQPTSFFVIAFDGGLEVPTTGLDCKVENIPGGPTLELFKVDSRGIQARAPLGLGTGGANADPGIASTGRVSITANGVTKQLLIRVFVGAP